MTVARIASAFVVLLIGSWAALAGGPATQSADTENIKTKNGFTAQLWVVDEATFRTLNKRPIPAPTPAKQVTHGQSVYVVVLLQGAPAGDDGKTNVTYDVTLLKPDGSEYGHFAKLDGWTKPPPPAGQLVRAERYTVVHVEADDPDGEYVVEARVTDHVRNTELLLRTRFTVSK
jgi:hypothetical protein